MNGKPAGQSLVETVLITSLVTLGMLGLWAVCSGKISDLTNRLLAVIASPLP